MASTRGACWWETACLCHGADANMHYSWVWAPFDVKQRNSFSAQLFTFWICSASQMHLSFIYAFNQARPARRLGLWETTAPLHTSQSLRFVLRCPIQFVCAAPPKVLRHSDTVFHTSTQCVYPSLHTPYPSLIAINWGRGCVYCFGCGALSVRSTSPDHFHLIFALFFLVSLSVWHQPCNTHSKIFLFWTTDKKNIYTTWVAIISFICAWSSEQNKFLLRKQVLFG